MDYIELECVLKEKDLSDVIVAALSQIGYESFMEENDHMLAYIPAKDFLPEKINELKNKTPDFSFSYKTVKEQNWNTLWESNFQPVMIASRCYIRAPFHKPDHKAEFEIIIEPKMSFGTAHHETTSMMIELMLDIDFENKTVLDVGSGTGILAILAEKKGAKEVLAVDNDDWAYRNSLENIERNSCTTIIAVHGDSSAIKSKNFDFILANINRNILLQDMSVYASCMHQGSEILFSGFYMNDLNTIKEKAVANGLVFAESITKSNWIAAKFIKKLD